jgi:hypothetical protein
MYQHGQLWWRVRHAGEVYHVRLHCYCDTNHRVYMHATTLCYTHQVVPTLHVDIYLAYSYFYTVSFLLIHFYI